MLTTLAPTHLHLYAQMLADGFTRDDIAKVDETYQPVARLCFRFFRGNGKPIVSHFASVASATAWDTRNILLIRAALAHTVLQSNKVPGLVRLKGRKAAAHFVSSKLGGDLMTFLELYQSEGSRVSFNPADHPDAIPHGPKRDLLHIKLADMLDHLNDEFAPQVTGKTLVAGVDHHQLARNCATLAEKVGAKRLRGAFAQLANTALPSDPVFSPFERTYDMKRIMEKWR
ncbi:MAG: hypothetical protein AAFO77_10695 [Pseudomonadota bacterium]